MLFDVNRILLPCSSLDAPAVPSAAVTSTPSGVTDRGAHEACFVFGQQYSTSVPNGGEERMLQVLVRLTHSAVAECAGQMSAMDDVLSLYRRVSTPPPARQTRVESCARKTKKKSHITMPTPAGWTAQFGPWQSAAPERESAPPSERYQCMSWTARLHGIQARRGPIPSPHPLGPPARQ